MHKFDSGADGGRRRWLEFKVKSSKARAESKAFNVLSPVLVYFGLGGEGDGAEGTKHT